MNFNIEKSCGWDNREFTIDDFPEGRHYLWQHPSAFDLGDEDQLDELNNLSRPSDKEVRQAVGRFWHDLAGKLGIKDLRECWWEEIVIAYPWPAIMGAMTELWATVDPTEAADHIRQFRHLLPKWNYIFQTVSAACQEARFHAPDELELTGNEWYDKQVERERRILANPFLPEAASQPIGAKKVKKGAKVA
jgi:hypothetical protein